MFNCIVLILYVLITAFGVGDLADQGQVSKDQLLAVLTGVNLALVVLAFLLRAGRVRLVMGRLPRLIAAVVAFAPSGILLIRSAAGALNASRSPEGASVPKSPRM